MKNLERFLKNEKNLFLIGFLQALAITIYISIVGAFMYLMSSSDIKPGFLGIVVMLVLFVFSAAITGILVFGAAVYLALEKKIREGLIVLVYTLLFLFVLFLITVLGLLFFN